MRLAKSSKRVFLTELLQGKIHSTKSLFSSYAKSSINNQFEIDTLYVTENLHKPQRVIERISSMDFVPSIINSLFPTVHTCIICVEQHGRAIKITFYCHYSYFIIQRALVDTKRKNKGSIQGKHRNHDKLVSSTSLWFKF